MNQQHTEKCPEGKEGRASERNVEEEEGIIKINHVYYKLVFKLKMFLCLCIKPYFNTL